MISSVSVCFAVSLLLLFWLPLSNFCLFSKCKAKNPAGGGRGGLTVDLNLLDNCCPLLLGDLFVNKHYLTSASRSMSPLPITTERLCFWERLTLQCVNLTAWERNLRRWSQPASPSAAAPCHWFGFEKFKPGLLSGPVERDPPLGSVVTFSWSETLLVLGWREPSQNCECF